MWTVFILYDHSLFARGIESLLNEKEGVKVVGLTEKGEEAFAKLSTLNPDVIIVENGIEEIKNGTLFLQYLQKKSPARFVRVNMDESAATLYTSCRWKVTGVEDLVGGIFGEPVAFG